MFPHVNYIYKIFVGCDASHHTLLTANTQTWQSFFQYCFLLIADLCVAGFKYIQAYKIR